jgi:hypothetical protein
MWASVGRGAREAARRRPAASSAAGEALGSDGIERVVVEVGWWAGTARSKGRPSSWRSASWLRRLVLS